MVNTPQPDQSLLFRPSNRKERHELTPEEAKEGFIMGVTKHIVLHFPWCSPDSYTERPYFLEPGHSRYGTTGLLPPWGAANDNTLTLEQDCTSAFNRHHTQEPVSKGRRVNHRPNADRQSAMSPELTSLTIFKHRENCSVWLCLQIWNDHGNLASLQKITITYLESIAMTNAFW